MTVPFLSYRSNMRIILLLALFAACLGMPTMVLNSGRGKCVAVEASRDTELKIKYNAMDLVVDKNDPNYGAAYLTVNVKPATRVFDTRLHEAPIKHRLRPTSQLLDEKEGTVTHKLEVDGEANICVRAGMASGKNPLRFGLQITKAEAAELPYKSKRSADSKDTVSSNLSRMEVEMRRIQAGMKNILAEADFSKERDALFHKQTLDMHSATMFWPIVRVLVLVMTGFTQASHIVRFFQSRRII